MKKLGATGMKVLKSIHLILVMFWVTGVLAMAMLFSIKPESADELYMTLKIIHFLDWNFVIPGALFTIIVGIIFGIFTNWRFFKYKWITIKWIVSILVIFVGTYHFSPLLEESLNIAKRTRDAALSDPVVASDLARAFSSSFSQGISLVILVIISVFKPWKKKKPTLEQRENCLYKT
jgi:uncharacterized membrane protein